MADKSLNLGTIFTADASQFFTTVEAMKRKLQTLNTAYAQTGRAAKKGMSGVSTAVDKTNKSFAKGGKRAQEYSKQIGKVEGAFKRTVAAMKVTASYGLAATAIFAVTNAFKAGIKEIVDYDQALKNLQAITRATDAEVVGMGETIKQVAETTKFSTGEVAEGMVLLGQAGFSASESMNAMGSVANLATGTLGDMKMVTDLLTTTIRAFNLDTIESARVSDVMANAINRSKLTIDKLRIAFNFVGAAAAQSGLSIEEVSASMMLLANNGLRASTIGTGMRQVLARLLAPNRRLREEFEAQGIELDKINPKTVGYQNAMKELTKVLYDAETKTVDMGKAYQLFGLRGAQAVSVLVKGFAGSGFQNMLDKTYEVGTAATMAEIQMQGLGVAFKNLVDRAKLVAVTMGEGGLTNSLRILVQVLKGLTIAIQAFLRSGLGQLLISIGAVTGATYLLAKAFVFLGTKALFLTRIFTGTKLVMGVLVSEFLAMNSAIGLTAAISGTLGTVFSRLYGIMAAHPFLTIALAVGAVVGAFNHYLGRTQRAIDATVKLTQETTNNVHALNVYSSALEVLAKKKKDGKKVDTEYITVLKRLIKAYPELKNEIELTTDAMEKNSKAVNKALGKETQKNIAESTRLVQLYTKSAEESRIKSGLMIAVSKSIDYIIGKVADFIGWIGDKWSSIFSFMGNLASRIPVFGDAIGTVFENLSDIFGNLIGNAKKFYSNLGKDSEEAKKAEERRLEVFRNSAKVMKEAGISAKGVTEELKKMGATAKDLENVTDAIDEQAMSLDEIKSKYSDVVEDVPKLFTKFYKNLDKHRKADFAKAVKAMDDEVAATKKKHKEIESTTELGYAVIASIKARHLLKYVDDNYKEILSEEELNRKKVEILDMYLLEVDRIYNDRTKKAQNAYQKEHALAMGSKDGLLAAETKFNNAIVEANKERAGAIEGIQLIHNERMKIAQKDLVDEIMKLNKKMAEDLLEQLKEKYGKIKDEVEDLVDEMKDLEESYNEAMRESRQKTMTEEEKFNDDRKELNRVMNEARTSNDADTWKTAFDLAKSLGREVTDEQGKVVKDMEETTRMSQTLMTEIHKEQMNLLKKEADAKRDEMSKTKSDMEELEDLVKEYGEAIDEVSKKELLLKMEKALESIGEAHGIVSKFKDKWDELQSKTITLKVNVEQTGGFNEGPDIVPEGKIGGIVKAQRGQKLPGFGGGDKIRALLEAGEWVIRKEAVQKYGSAMFQALNSLTFDVQDFLGGAMKKMGGFITQPVQKFQTGGPTVSAESGGGSTNIYKITFAPQFMTGDEAAMRNVAPELKRALEELDDRWGR